ncbi:hypothetical protein CONLIGDRAFT_577439 [Coniochaeta ligniaria NRRL 30616]|uniref:Vacuolar import and degradation protein n=1 Tax=Coniochaeta ligniaria NRRL 30616 TaxID=1408157 RepID=A0A1J7IMK0_9PEZI|nr:hypothetical protein CONLIGDRAFT_577439 [Coniochaeta ligniaria NRRL 30616]
MPTPSGNAPDHSPRNFAFSSCPDPEDNEQQPQQQQQQQPPESPISPASPSSPSSQTLRDSQESPSSWRPESSPSQLQYDILHSPADDSASPRSATMSPMSSSVAAALADGSGDFESSGEPGEVTDPLLRGARRRPDAVRSRSAADYSTRPGGEGSSSTRDDENTSAWGADTSMLGMGYEYADPRVTPISPSTYLRPGSRFHGTQQSERQRYDVQVEIKHVDLRESFLCGYLRIQGLTEDHPTLTTYFEGEIIGTKYGFNTQHPSWGASDKTDLSHWAKFQAFRPFQKQMKKGSGNIVIKDVANRENIFMRWKEHFLVPDHRVRTIHGASFEGFYYICFNQLRGEVSGIYFHSKSEKFQQLELKHVEDKGCYGAVEFR